MIPNRCFDRVFETVVRVMQEPSRHLPIPAEWGMGPFLPIGVSAKTGRNWAPRLTEADQMRIHTKSGSTPPLNLDGMHDIAVPSWVPTAGTDDPVLPQDDSDLDDWRALARVVA
jgi:hypothetical protein